MQLARWAIPVFHTRNMRNRRGFFRRIVHNVSLGSCVIGVIACSKAPEPTPQESLPKIKLKVVALTSQLAELAREIGGSAVEVELILNTQSSLAKPPAEGAQKPPWQPNPFAWQPRATDLFALQTAHLVLLNGLGLEKSLEGQEEKLRKQGVIVVVAGDAVPKEERLSMPGDANSLDPTFWNSPRLWKHAIAAVTAGMKQLVAPEAADYFEFRANPILARMDRLMDWSKERLATARLPGHRFILTSHDALRYFTKEFGIEAKAMWDVHGGLLPTPRAELDAWLGQHGVTDLIPDIALNTTALEELLIEHQLKSSKPICSIYLDRPGTSQLGLLEAFDIGTYEGAFKAMIRVMEKSLGSASDE